MAEVFVGGRRPWIRAVPEDFLLEPGEETSRFWRKLDARAITLSFGTNEDFLRPVR